MFTPEENKIECVFAYELYHKSLSMSVAEFIDENRNSAQGPQ